MQASFFTANRNRLIDLVGSSPVILAGYTSMQRSGDASFSFEQEATFWWLTGIEAPDWQLIIADGRTYLVSPLVSTTHQIFDGSLSWDDAKKNSGVDVVISLKESRVLLKKLAEQYSAVVTLGKDPMAAHYDFSMNPAPLALLRRLKRQFKEVKDCRLMVARLRAIKQPEEIQAIQQAINLTIQAFQQVRGQLDRYTHEYQIEADFSHYFRHNVATGHAYDPIVASGSHACTLHYIDNNAPLQQNELLLLDIGARKNGYAADITRTYAIGQPTQRHIEVHAAVERAHHEIISLLRPGLNVKQYSDQSDEIMKSALASVGLHDFRKYFPHAISHGLGVDVHDALGRPETFLPGMVLTVEPGIYIPEEGIGVRIEDDILITENGHRNLSQKLSTSL